MADMKIEDATRDTSVTGVELFPASDNGAPRSVSAEKLGDYIIGRITNATASTVFAVDSDKFFILQDGNIKPFPLSYLIRAFYGYINTFIDASPDATDKLVLIQSDDQSVNASPITLADLVDWLEAHIAIDADMDIAALDDAGSLSAVGQYLAIAQDEDTKKVSLAAVRDFILDNFYSNTSTQTASIADGDYIYIWRTASGAQRKVTLENSGLGDVKGPSSTTANNVPRWDSSARKLKDGVPIVDSIAATPTGTKIASEAAVATVRTAIQSTIDSMSAEVSAKLSATLATEINTTTTADDTRVPSAKAVKTYLESALSSWATTALAPGGVLSTAIANAVSTSVSAAVSTSVAAAVGPAVEAALTTALGEEGEITEAISSAVTAHGALEVGTTSGTTHPGATEE